MQTTIWWADGNFNESSRCIASDTIESDAIDNAAPLSKEAMRVRRSAAKLRRQLTPSMKQVALTDASLEEEATSGLTSPTSTSRVALTVDLHAADSYRGANIRTSHTMVVALKGGFSRMAPLELPIYIGSSSSPNPATVPDSHV